MPCRARTKRCFRSFFQHSARSYPDRQRLELVIAELQRFGTVPLASWLEPFGGLFLRFKRYEKMARLARSFAAAPPAGTTTAG